MCEHGTSEQVPIDGRVRDIDACIAKLVIALNAGGFPTIASCCGHGKIPASIGLADGRWLVIVDWEQMREALHYFGDGLDIHGDPWATEGERVVMESARQWLDEQGEPVEGLSARREDGRGDNPEGGTAPEKPRARAGSPKRELLCENCGRDYPVWYADNELWNAVMRTDGVEVHQFVCLTCFALWAVFAGEETIFRVSRAEPGPGCAP